jgi:hypothetical protein
MRRSFRKSWLAAGALAAAFTTASAEPFVSDIANPEWAGFSATGITFTHLSAEWRQPALDCTTTKGDVSVWIGFEAGARAGVTAKCDAANATAHYQAWAGGGQDPFDVAPGDVIDASMNLHDGQFSVRITDVTNGGSAEASDRCDDSCPRRKALWIASRHGDLANFGVLDISNIQAGRDEPQGAAYAVRSIFEPDAGGANPKLTRITMRNGNNVLAQPGDIINETSSGFRVTWKAGR